MVLRFFNYIGNTVIQFFSLVGSFTIFILTAIKTCFSTKLKVGKFFVQSERIGVNSFFITIITGGFAGAVLALQSYKGFQKFGGEEFIGSVVALSMIRELGPVLTGLMVAGRSGSAIAAELGSMRISEQIDALKTLCIDTYQYLVVPRILAGTLILPFLALFAMMFGIVGGYLVFTKILGLNGEEYASGIKEFVEIWDVIGGLIKSAVFGFLLTAIGAYKGYKTKGGARGLGIATTQSVVSGSILIIISNYFLAVILFGPS